jgi:hypothetical protein
VLNAVANKTKVADTAASGNLFGTAGGRLADKPAPIRSVDGAKLVRFRVVHVGIRDRVQASLAFCQAGTVALRAGDFGFFLLIANACSWDSR